MGDLNWDSLIKAEQDKPYFQELNRFLSQERSSGKKIFPSQECVFEAFNLTAFQDVKVVILGQDPYHGQNQAHGLSFSVQDGVKVPPSLRNIYKELSSDIDAFEIPLHGNLTSWAKQGVLLLNTVLTVEEGLAHSHAKKGWESFTDQVIKAINGELTSVVFILWGAHAQKKREMIDESKHHILASAHPSPLSARRGFFGCQHFSKTNLYLQENGKKTINWKI